MVFGDILPLDERTKNEMRGVSYHVGCPVGLDELRLVRVQYHSFTGTTKNGELMVHKDVADEILAIFGELYDIHYPIKQIVRIEKFNGDDFDSIEADNTSAFNCRNATGEKKYSKHSYGKAIDINPIENPYIFRGNRTSHKASYPFINRNIKNPTTPQEKAMLLPNNEAVKIFTKYGWRWGGDWEIKDYQHFDKR
jgi:poly-gamma-glutamate synthesis protein (capsule biosynthesis protein)